MIKVLKTATAFLNRNTGFLILSVIIIFGLSTLGFQKDSESILKDTRTTTKNTEKIIKDLEIAVDDLKADNARQTRFIECLLAFHGASELISQEVQDQCERMSANVELEDVTRPQTTPSVSVTQTTPGLTQTPPTSPEDNTPTPPVDNEGIIINLPLLPEIYIPSPL